MTYHSATPHAAPSDCPPPCSAAPCAASDAPRTRPPRDTAIDLLKIIAIFGVLLLHSLAAYYDGGKSPSLAVWFQCYMMQSFCVFAVPVFVMCSGAFMLCGTKDQPPLAFYAKRLPKIVLPLFVWSIVYYIYKVGPGQALRLEAVPVFFRQFLEGTVIGNFWFLYMLLGIYLAAPFLQMLMRVTSRGQQWLFVGLSLGLPGFVELCRPVIALQLGLSYSMFAPYVGYFVLGHLLQTAKPNLRHQAAVFLSLAVLGMALTMAAQWHVHLLDSRYQFLFLDYPMPNAACIAAAMFLGIRGFRFAISDRCRQRISLVGQATYGIYLTHILAKFLLKIGIFGPKLVATDFTPLVGGPLIATGTFVLSLAMVLVLSRIPLLRKSVGY